MHAFSLARLIVFGTTLAFALIVLGVSANFVALISKFTTTTSSLYYYNYSGFFFGSSVAGFGVATAVLTFAILIPVLVIDFLRKGAVTSLAASELGFVGFLWILWLACAGHSTSALGGFSLNCGLYDSDFASYCSQYQALQAFSWLNWLMLFFYWIALLVYALIAQSRGHRNAFMVPATDLAASLPPAGNAGGEPKIPPTQNYPPGSITPGTYPPQGQQGQYPQQSFTPSQYPQQGYTPGPAPPQGQAYQPSYASSPAPPAPNAIQV